MEAAPGAVDRPESHRRLTEPLEAILWLMLAFVVATLGVSLISTATSGHAV